jgi:hypothetical protein
MQIVCPKCGLKHAESVLNCDCGYDLQLVQARLLQQQKSKTSWGQIQDLKGIGARPYPVLFIMSKLVFVCVILAGVGGVLTLVGGLLMRHMESIVLGVFLLLVMSVGLGFVELILLLLDMRERQELIIEQLTQERKTA